MKNNDFILTKEQRKENIKNKKKAREFFNAQPDWVLHHIDPSWRHDNIERYIQWNTEDLVMMTKSEHTRWHWTHDANWKQAVRGKKETKKHKENMSKARKGQTPVYLKERKQYWKDHIKNLNLSDYAAAKKMEEAGYPINHVSIWYWRQDSSC